MFSKTISIDLFADVSARYSPACCIRLIEQEGRALRVLTDLVKRLNRSLPHMEVQTTICDLFISLAELENTRTYVATLPQCRESVLDALFYLMTMYTDKKKGSLSIFSKCCSVLWKLASHPMVLQVNYIPILVQVCTRRGIGLYQRSVEYRLSCLETRIVGLATKQ